MEFPSGWRHAEVVSDGLSPVRVVSHKDLTGVAFHGNSFVEFGFWWAGVGHVEFFFLGGGGHHEIGLVKEV